MLALRPHGVVLAVEANVQLVDPRALGMLVALARSVAALAHVGKVAAVTKVIAVLEQRNRNKGNEFIHRGMRTKVPI